MMPPPTFVFRTTDAAQVVACYPDGSVGVVAVDRLPVGWAGQPLPNVIAAAQHTLARAAATAAGLGLIRLAEMYVVAQIAPLPPIQRHRGSAGR